MQDLEGHSLLRKISWYHDCFAFPVGSTIKIRFTDDADDSAYPTISVHWDNVAPNVIEQADGAQEIYHSFFNIVETLRKIAIALESVATIDVGNFQSIRVLEYHVENYLVRVPTILEQVYSAARHLLDIPWNYRRSIRDFERLLKNRQPALWRQLAVVKSDLRDTKLRRNEVAHQGGFFDARLTGVRAFLGTEERLSTTDRPYNDQLVFACACYQTDFLLEATKEMESLIGALTKTFAVLERTGREKLEKAH